MPIDGLNICIFIFNCFVELEPTSEWNKNTRGKNWLEGNFYHLVIFDTGGENGPLMDTIFSRAILNEDGLRTVQWF